MKASHFKKYLKDVPNDYDIVLTTYYRIDQDIDQKLKEEKGFIIEPLSVSGLVEEGLEHDKNKDDSDDGFVEIVDETIIGMSINHSEKAVRFVLLKSDMESLDDIDDDFKPFKGFRPKVVKK